MRAAKAAPTLVQGTSLGYAALRRLDEGAVVTVQDAAQVEVRAVAVAVALVAGRALAPC